MSKQNKRMVFCLAIISYILICIVGTQNAECQIENMTDMEWLEYCLNEDTTDENKYIDRYYMCADFTSDLWGNLTRCLRSHNNSLKIEPTFLTSTKGYRNHIIVSAVINNTRYAIEPQNDAITPIEDLIGYRMYAVGRYVDSYSFGGYVRGVYMVRCI